MEDDRNDLDCCEDCGYQEYLMFQDEVRKELEALKEELKTPADHDKYVWCPELIADTEKEIERLKDLLEEPYDKFEWDPVLRRSICLNRITYTGSL